MSDFIRQIIDRDLAAGKHPGGVVTRFPPEPNGYLHIGHAKSIVLNFGLAEEYAPARCHLRFDDTNPITENSAYVEAIQEDVRWLGFDWGEHLYFASDYFDQLYAWAEFLIERGLAYVDASPEEVIREMRGTVTEPGRPTPDRDRPSAESLDLFRRMRAGEFPDGAMVLRAKIDLASPNMLMRDPVLYRIRHAHHYRTGDDWCIYPLYDYAHCLEDAIEGVTHSLCTLEFDNNREIYDWLIEHCPVPSTPRQYEFARLNLDYTVMSKRKLLRLVTEGDVTGWDDPRMPTVAGLRRRGVTPEAIRSFCEMIGVAKADSRVDIAKLEYAIRDDLNHRAPRVMAVLDPIRVVLTNWPEGEVETLDAPLWPRDVPKEGSRPVPFSGELLIDRDDFAEDPPPGFRRLVPGGVARLRHGYLIRCDEVVKDDAGRVVELRCTYDPATRSGVAGSGEPVGGADAGENRVAGDPDFGWKARGTIHWVSEAHSIPIEARIYDRLFTVPDPEDAGVGGGGRPGVALSSDDASGDGDANADADFRSFLNPDSLRVMKDARVEPWVVEASSPGGDPGARFQFERIGYFRRDPVDGRGERPIFNRIVTLAGGAKIQAPLTVSVSSTMPPVRPRVDPSAGLPVDLGGGAPELPPELQARADALAREFGLTEVEAAILARDPDDEGFYRAAVAAWTGPIEGDAGAGALANWFIHSLPSVRGKGAIGELPFDAAAFAALVSLVEDGTLSSRGGGEVLAEMARGGGDPAEITRRLDLAQVSDDDALLPDIHAILDAHPDRVTAWRGGKTGLTGFFMGELMRRTGGKADPARAKELLEAELAGGGTEDGGPAVGE